MTHAQVLAEALVKFTKWQDLMEEREDYLDDSGETTEGKLVAMLYGVPPEHYGDPITIADKLIGGSNAPIFMDAAKRIESLENRIANYDIQIETLREALREKDSTDAQR